MEFPEVIEIHVTKRMFELMIMFMREVESV